MTLPIYLLLAWAVATVAGLYIVSSPKFKESTHE